MSLPHLAVVLPAYNEAEGITGFVHELVQHLRPEAQRLTVVVVDDCSTDSTPATLRALRREVPELVVVRSARNRGHGPTALEAYRMGLEHRPDAVLHVDGDGQFHGRDAARVARALRQGDAVHGVRTGRDGPWYRRVVTLGLGALAGLLAGGRVRDVNTPLRAYRAETLTRLLAGTPRESLVPHVHFTLLERRLRIPVVAVNVESLPRRGANSSGTMWGPARRSVLPPLKLVRFVLAAGSEVLASRAGRMP